MGPLARCNSTGRPAPNANRSGKRCSVDATGSGSRLVRYRGVARFECCGWCRWLSVTTLVVVPLFAFAAGFCVTSRLPRLLRGKCRWNERSGWKRGIRLWCAHAVSSVSDSDGVMIVARIAAVIRATVLKVVARKWVGRWWVVRSGCSVACASQRVIRDSIHLAPSNRRGEGAYD